MIGTCDLYFRKNKKSYKLIDTIILQTDDNNRL